MFVKIQELGGKGGVLSLTPLESSVVFLFAYKSIYHVRGKYININLRPKAKIGLALEGREKSIKEKADNREFSP